MAKIKRAPSWNESNPPGSCSRYLGCLDKYLASEPGTATAGTLLTDVLAAKRSWLERLGMA